MENLIAFSLNGTMLNATARVMDAILAFLTADAGFGAVVDYTLEGKEWITPPT